jgi:uncharacterized damage-inducible protein DinB
MSLVDLLQSEIERRLLEESIPRIIQCLNELPEDAIWYKKNEQTNSVGNLVLHLCGNVRQYFISSIGGKPDNRKRREEFLASSRIKKQLLIEQLEQLAKEVKLTVAAVTEQELLRERKVQGFSETGMSIVVHIIEHFSYHTGQIAYYTKYILNKDLKFYGDLDLDVVG